VFLPQRRTTAMTKAGLLTLNLKTSPLPTLFHVRDVIGCDLLDEVDRSMLLPGMPESTAVYFEAPKKRKK
jgi:hypothetical protein